MAYNVPKLFRQANTFDVMLACPACKAAIEKDRRTNNVCRWQCDTCRLFYVPFFSELWVVEIDPDDSSTFYT